MKKVVKLKESDLIKLVEQVIELGGNEITQTDGYERQDRYMFFSNLEQMQRQCGLLLDLNHQEIDELLDNGHDWAQDHIAEAKNNLDQVFDFIMNETKRYHTMGDEVMMENELEERKKKSTKKKKKNVPTNPSKWQYWKNQAKKKFDVYPSAYANGWAVNMYNKNGGKWKKG